MRELSLKLNELEAKSRTTEIISEANEATTLTLNDRMASLEKELRNLSIDEIGLEGGLIFFCESTYHCYYYFREN